MLAQIANLLAFKRLAQAVPAVAHPCAALLARQYLSPGQ
jgi:hypothetical protein